MKMQKYLTFFGPEGIDTEQMRRFDSVVKDMGMNSLLKRTQHWPVMNAFAQQN